MALINKGCGPIGMLLVHPAKVGGPPDGSPLLTLPEYYKALQELKVKRNPIVDGEPQAEPQNA